MKRKKAPPKKKKDLSKLVKVKVVIKRGKRAGKTQVVWRKKPGVETKPEPKEEKPEGKKEEQRKTRPLHEFDYKSTEPTISAEKQEKSLLSPYYYQVPFMSAGKRMWKLYPNAAAYRKDFPGGPQAGHLLVNQAHPDHLEIDPKAEFATVGGKKYMTAAEFLADHPVPSPTELKKMFRGVKDDAKKRFSGDVVPNFHHIEWQPGSKVFNANQRFFLGVQRDYEAYRKPMQEKYDRERYARAGVPWTKEDYETRNKIVSGEWNKGTGAEQQSKSSGAKKRKERLFSNPSANQPLKNAAELARLEESGNIKKGTSVKFILGGKVFTGKVIHAGSYNSKGESLKNKAATHFKVRYNTAGDTANKGGKNKEIILTKDRLERTGKAYVRKPKKEVAAAMAERRKEAENTTLESAKQRLGAKSDAEFQKRVLELMAGEHGLDSHSNPINKFLERKVEEIVGDWGSHGTLQTMRGSDGRLYVADLSHRDLMDAARVGVFDAVMNYDPKKGSLIQFIGSDSTKHFIKEALKESLAIERGRIDTLSQEGRTILAKMKFLDERFRMLNDGRKPTNLELIEDYRHQYPDDYQNVQRRKSYDLHKIIETMRRSKVSNIVRAPGAGGEEGEIDLIEQAHSPFKTPEQAALEKVHMSDFRTNLYHTLHASYTASGHKNPEKQARKAALAMQLRHRVDESTTGMGTFGEESPYHATTPDQARAYEKQYEGRATTGKDPHLRPLEDVGKLLGISSERAAALIDDAQQRVRDQYTSGNEHATKLFKQFFQKSFEQKLLEMQGYMLKSLFPETRDIPAEHDLQKAYHLMRATFFQAA